MKGTKGRKNFPLGQAGPSLSKSQAVSDFRELKETHREGFRRQAPSDQRVFAISAQRASEPSCSPWQFRGTDVTAK